MMRVRFHKDDKDMVELYTVGKYGKVAIWSVMPTDCLESLGIDRRWLDEVDSVELRQTQGRRFMTWEVV